MSVKDSLPCRSAGVERDSEAVVRMLQRKFTTQFHDSNQRGLIVQSELGHI
jgi:hypothetical protein